MVLLSRIPHLTQMQPNNLYKILLGEGCFIHLRHPFIFFETVLIWY